MEKTGVHCTWRETSQSKERENPQQTQPTFGVTARICARATLVRALRHPCYRLLKTSDYRCLITEVIVPHRDGLGVLLLYHSQSHFAKWKINIKVFFSVKTIARNLGKMYHSLTAGHLQLDESVRLNTLVIRCFFTSPTTVSKLLSPFHKKRGHEKRFSLPTTNSARLKQTKQRQNQGTTLQF